MTPAQLAVEADALLAGGRTPEEVARMQRWSGESEFERLLIAWVEHLPPPFLDHACVECVGAQSAGEWGSTGWRCLWHRARVLRSVLLSLPESASGASASRPSGETP